MVVFAAVKDCLVRSRFFTDTGQCLNDPFAETFTLHTGINGDIFDMTNDSIATNEFVLHQDGSGRDELIVILVDDDEDVVGRCLERLFYMVKSLYPRCFAYIGDFGEHCEKIQMSSRVV